jgi:formamidopyrimidine-DNA glycosylase
MARCAPVTARTSQVRLRLAVHEVAWDLIRVYKQEHCYDCGTPIVTGTIEGRATCACPRCQPEWAG